MVSGAIIIETYGNGGEPMRYTCDSANSFTKGDLLKLIDPVTASGANFGITTPAAGIAAMDKSASDGSTSISVYTNVRADIVASGAIGVGVPVIFVADNYVRGATGTVTSGAVIAGWALETASDNERIAVRIRL